MFEATSLSKLSTSARTFLPFRTFSCKLHMLFCLRLYISWQDHHKSSFDPMYTNVMKCIVISLSGLLKINRIMISMFSKALQLVQNLPFRISSCKECRLFHLQICTSWPDHHRDHPKV